MYVDPATDGYRYIDTSAARCKDVHTYELTNHVHVILQAQLYLESGQLFLVPSSGLGLQIAGAAGNNARLLEECAVQ